MNIAGSLPKGEANGFEAHSRLLSEALVKGQKFFAVGVVKTHSVKTGDDLVPVPTVAFTRVELVPLDATDLETVAADLLQAATDLRRGGAGQQAFNLRSDDGAEEDAEPEVLELDAGPGYYFVIRDLPAGRFGIYLHTQHIETGRKRGNLLRSELGEVAPGEYQLYELPKALQPIAEVLVEEWESNAGTAVVDDVVDAEVVDDEESAGGVEGGDDE